MPTLLSTPVASVQSHQRSPRIEDVYIPSPDVNPCEVGYVSYDAYGQATCSIDALSTGSTGGTDSSGSTAGAGGSCTDPYGCQVACITDLDDAACVVADEPTCNGGRGLGDSANGYDGHDDKISAEFEVFQHSGDVSQTVGWEYQTYGGQEYFQFNFTVTVSAGVSVVSLGFSSASSPVVPFNGSVWNALQTALQISHIAASALPYPLNSFTSSTSVNKIRCGAGTATG